MDREPTRLKGSLAPRPETRLKGSLVEGYTDPVSTTIEADTRAAAHSTVDLGESALKGKGLDTLRGSDGEPVEKPEAEKRPAVYFSVKSGEDFEYVSETPAGMGPGVVRLKSLKSGGIWNVPPDALTDPTRFVRKEDS